MQYYFRDHLSDLGLRQCHLISRAIWMDMLCWMGQGQPYGYLRLETATEHAWSTTWYTTRGLPHGTPRVVPQRQYKPGKDGSLEPCLPILLGESPELVKWAVADLEAHDVFSRTPTGVIYCRRMVRDEAGHEERVRKASDAYQKRIRAGRNSGKSVKATPKNSPRTSRSTTRGIPRGGARVVDHMVEHAATPHGGPHNHNHIYKTPPQPPPSGGGASDPPRLTRAERQRRADIATIEELKREAHREKTHDSRTST